MIAWFMKRGRGTDLKIMIFNIWNIYVDSLSSHGIFHFFWVFNFGDISTWKFWVESKALALRHSPNIRLNLLQCIFILITPSAFLRTQQESVRREAQGRKLYSTIATGNGKLSMILFRSESSRSWINTVWRYKSNRNVNLILFRLNVQPTRVNTQFYKLHDLAYFKRFSTHLQVNALLLIKSFNTASSYENSEFHSNGWNL